LTDIKETTSTEIDVAYVLKSLAEHLTHESPAAIDVEFDHQIWQPGSETYLPVEAVLRYRVEGTERLIIVEGWNRKHVINAMFIRAVARKRSLSQADRAVIVARRMPTAAAIKVARELKIDLLVWKQARAPA
jgi:hypothetical protein